MWPPTQRYLDLVVFAKVTYKKLRFLFIVAFNISNNSFHIRKKNVTMNDV